MKKMRKLLSLLLALAMVASLAACGGGGDETTAPSESTGEPTAPVESTGSGEALWTEEKTADGWIKVINPDGTVLGYSADSGVTILTVDGYAFKDMDRDGELDVYEDWRLDAEVRAADLANQMSGEEIAPMLTHGGWNSFGSEIEEGSTDYEYIMAGGRGGVTRSVGKDGNTAMSVTWVNALQAMCEATGDYGIPATVSVDPCNISGLIDQNALAASMDPEFAWEVAVETSRQYRAVGITMVLGPQIDIATNPTWSRANGAYTEDPALSRDLANAYISGLQSTYAEDGTDLGWGEDSVVSIAKHYAGAGASEGGRNDHFDPGKYTTFPGNNYAAHLIAFHDGAFNLDSVTGSAGGLMPNYAISYSADGSLGELVAGAYSEFKINMLRDNGFDGFILTDWQITDDESRNFGDAVVAMTVAERFCHLFKIGNDQIGGTSDTAGATEGYHLLVAEVGQEAADARMREAATHFFITQINTDLWENPYIDYDYAMESVWSIEAVQYGLETQERGAVLLKNTGNIVHENDGSEKMTVYIPYVFTAGSEATSSSEATPSSWSAAIDINLVSKYFNVVTDSVAEPSGTDAEGNPVYTENDVIRASSEELAACDLALVTMSGPMVDSEQDAEGNWLPASIQYEAYTATTARQESVAADVVDGVRQNRSYYGNTSSRASNYSELELLQYVANAVPESCSVAVIMSIKAPMVWTEVEPLADVILVHFTGMTSGWDSEDVLLQMIAGYIEPTGLLPYQQPASMEAVEAQNEDVPRDLECHVDANGNTYDFAFGLNWSGVINDERVQKYSAEPLTTPETITFQYAN